MLDRPDPAVTMMPSALGLPAVEWAAASAPVAYPDAVATMEARVGAIAAGTATEQVWLVEHPALYTAGTSARASDLLEPGRLPVYPSGRGGQYTYHGPGQRVAYVMLDLNRRRPDLRRLVTALEEWVIRTVGAFGIAAGRRRNCVGIWVPRPDKGEGREDKIAAIGIRVRRWVTFHGIALNVAPDLANFGGIVPCGIRSQGVTSLADLGVSATMRQVDIVLRREFEAVFGPTTARAPGPDGARSGVLHA
ncbi:MAG TPA: lipoyl(octanoyl) transferase LipB [Bauldia sp.]|nr:lipoyl(octanoyl) transferase LipB [Bauldia sp.]